MLEKVAIKTAEIVEAPESINRSYPRRFVGFVAEYGHEALCDYLKKQDAPPEIQELAEALRGITMTMEESGDLVPDCYNESIGDNLATIGRALHYTGTQVHTSDSIFSL